MTAMLQRSEPGEPGGKARLSAGIKLGRKTSASSDARNVVLFATATKRLRECGVRKEVSTGWRRQFLFLSSCGPTGVVALAGAGGS